MFLFCLFSHSKQHDVLQIRSCSDVASDSYACLCWRVGHVQLCGSLESVMSTLPQTEPFGFSACFCGLLSHRMAVCSRCTNMEDVLPYILTVNLL